MSRTIGEPAGRFGRLSSRERGLNDTTGPNPLHGWLSRMRGIRSRPECSSMGSQPFEAHRPCRRASTWLSGYMRRRPRETARRTYQWKADRVTLPPPARFCHWCKRPLLAKESTTTNGQKHPLARTWDHIEPRAAGGRVTVWCCHFDNDLKSGVPLAMWRAFMQSTPRWWEPERAAFRRLFRQRYHHISPAGWASSEGQKIIARAQAGKFILPSRSLYRARGNARTPTVAAPP